MYYIRVDYHKKYSYVLVKDREGTVERRGTVNNSKEEFWQLLKPYQRGKAVFWKRPETGGLSMTGWRRSWMMWLWPTR